MFAAAAAGRPVVVTDPAGPPAAAPSDLPPETFLVVVTSGTSGHPRPVLRTAASWTSSFAAFGDLTGIGPDDRVLLTGPLHATMHLFAAVHTLAVGAHLVDDPASATVAHAVPSRLATLLDELDDLDDLDAASANSPLRTVVVAGASLPDALAARARDRGLAVVEYYGAAELSFVAARRVPGPLRPFPGAEIELRAGVLWVRSPYLSLGYPGGVDGPYRRDPDGFATVGDLAEAVDAADGAITGGLRIRGRGDAAITTAGATVVAEDVEQALSTLPGVAAVAVVGVPHPRLGHLVVAVVQPAPGADLTGIRGDARRRLRAQSLPRRWLIADSLPRTPGGKVARHAVSAAVAALDDGRPAPAGAPVLRPLPSTP
ncbi:fatty acid--CoA ligase family protein [Nakamurella sp.]|uniref:fatty acid--CoA ligase family protein n=1 Tax=Nakamurella sp. TaxID=1869182 RepID=UPI0037852C8D